MFSCHFVLKSHDLLTMPLNCNISYTQYCEVK